MVQRFALLLFICLFFCAVFSSVRAQSLLFESFEIPIPQADTTLIFDNWLDEHSIVIRTLPDSILISDWRFDEETGQFYLPKLDSASIVNQKALSIYYGRLPTSLSRQYQKNVMLEYIPELEHRDSVSRPSSSPGSGFSSDIQQSGSLSRGIIVGSNQDFALESGLQFQLQGQLTDDIRLYAILTDQSIPFQPDGTTQSIREFDRVLIRLRSEQAQLEMGDVDVNFTKTTFGKLNRRLQGASGSYSGDLNQSKFAVSSVRGTFTTQRFEGIEGTRGPYRLTGSNGEPFVIILAGTERVYINGELVERGEENEYIIDYGLGEIYFTDQVFIKDETRIFVEYEYVDQEFSRTLLAGETSQKLWDDRFELGVSVIRMADGNDLLSQQSLSRDDIDVLESVGDDIQNALVSGIVANPDDDAFNIRYALVDTLYNGQSYQIFKNIAGSNSSNLAVRFSNVGQGNGSYVRVGSALNGLLYEWKGPGKGSYEPFRNLPAPEKHQMISITGAHSITENIRWYGEFALSDVDRNRFSSLDDDDNADFALIGGFEASDLELGATVFDFDYRHRQSGKNFEAFERTREVEFDRKWNINQNEISGEKVDELSIGALINNNIDIDLGAGRLTLPGQESLRQSVSIDAQIQSNSKFNYYQEFSSTEFNQIGFKNNWLKQQAILQTTLSDRLSSYVNVEHENKRDRSGDNDLTGNSFRFYEIAPGLAYRFEQGVISGGIAYRDEDILQNEQFVDEYTAIEQQYGLEWKVREFFTTNNKVRFRNKNFSADQAIQGKRNTNALLINSENQIETERLNLRSRYSVSTQRRSIAQETYFEVGPELGQYVWIDNNKNGIEEIDEFFPELSPNEGTYILQFLPSDELIPTTELSFRNGFEWSPFRGNRSDNDANNVLESLELESRFDIFENTTNPNENDIYLLRLDTFRDDSLTIQGRLSWSQRVRINPTEKWESSAFYSSSKSLNKRTSEIVKTFDQLLMFENEYRINSHQWIELSFSRSVKENSSTELVQRTYNIKSWEIEPGYRVRFSRSLQFGLQAGYTSKVNRSEFNSDTNAEIIRSILSTRAFLIDRIQFGSNVEFRNTKVTGATNTFTNYELTEGTGAGKHLIWNINAGYRISNLVRITFNYDGRTVAERSDIHTIKLVVSAIF
ncbi:MAG: hypothetical protein JJ895_04140 [Balneolaceae bacterium]|nr:hypothetical protein [Balneolaceae bacterium]